MSLSEALELTALIAQHDAPRSRRAAARWFRRYLDTETAPTIDDVALVAGCLGGLGGPRHAEVLLTLRAVAERAPD